MILLLAFDYIFGELAYSIFDRVIGDFDLFIFNFFSIMGIEAIICCFMLKINTMRATAYATLNIIAMLAHMYGLYVFVEMIDSSAYTSMLLSLLCAKIAVVVMPDVRYHIGRFFNHIRDIVAYSSSFIFIAQSFKADI